MKHQIYNWSIMLGSILLLSCQNTATTSSATATDTTTDGMPLNATVSATVTDDTTPPAPQEQPLQLPALKSGEEVEFENDKVRIVTTEPEGLLGRINVQPKSTLYKQFKIQGVRITFEKILGKTLVASEGSGIIRRIWVYDLTTGEKVLEAKSFADIGIPITVENEHQFSYYRYDEALPQISWNEEKEVWENVNQVPAQLLNDDLEEAKENSQGNLYNGLMLIAYQKVKVDIQNRKVTPLNQYKWEAK